MDWRWCSSGVVDALLAYLRFEKATLVVGKSLLACLLRTCCIRQSKWHTLRPLRFFCLDAPWYIRVVNRRSRANCRQTAYSLRSPIIGSEMALMAARVFFLSGCCMAQRRSWSGRSPFCQLKRFKESQIRWK